MATFYESRNNGVIAVIRAEDAPLFESFENKGSDPYGVIPVFTFCDSKRMESEPGVFTGSYSFLKRLIDGKGHTLIAHTGGTGWSGFVPFSNQEHRINSNGDWRKYITPPEVVFDVFGYLA